MGTKHDSKDCLFWLRHLPEYPYDDFHIFSPITITQYVYGILKILGMKVFTIFLIAALAQAPPESKTCPDCTVNTNFCFGKKWKYLFCRQCMGRTKI